MTAPLTRLSRRDRAALVLAYECLKATSVGVACATEALRCASIVSLVRVIPLVIEEARREAVHGSHGGDVRLTVTHRMLRARLALFIRAVLRADRGDLGPMHWVGCSCSCDGDAGGWVLRPYRALWAGTR